MEAPACPALTHLVVYWRHGHLVICNYATRTTAAATPLICDLLNACTDWKSVAGIEHALRATGLAPLIERLIELTFLQASDRPPLAQEEGMSSLMPWNPEAGLFHTATRDVAFFIPAARPPLRSREGGIVGHATAGQTVPARCENRSAAHQLGRGISRRPAGAANLAAIFDRRSAARRARSCSG